MWCVCLKVFVAFTDLCSETNTVDSSILLDNLISPLLFHTPLSSPGSPSLYSAGLHLSHLLSTLRPSRTKRGTAAASAKEGKSPWGMTEEQKKM